MRKSLWLFTLISIFSMGCERMRWSNQIETLALECGVSENFSSDKSLLLKLDSFDATVDEQDLEVFKVKDASNMEPLDFELTPKHCLQLNRKELDASHRVAVIFKKRQAAEFVPKDDGVSIVTAQLKDCGSYCRAFPLCGFMNESGDKRNSERVFKLQVAEGIKVNAAIESEFVNRPLDVNSRQCFAVSTSSVGNLKIQDSNGNFFEGAVEQVVAQSLRSVLPVESLTLRGPLTEQERACKIDPVHFRMDGTKCVPKTFRFYCEDSPAHSSVIAFSNFFVRKECSRIEEFLLAQTDLEFVYKNLSEVEVLSGLKNIKRINLSGNKISSLNSLRGLVNVESIILTGNIGTFDISSISQFDKLKTLDISNTAISNVDRLPEMESVEELKISSDHISIVGKFKQLRRLYIEGGNRLDLSYLSGEKLQVLSIFTVTSVVGLHYLGRFSELEELKLEFIKDFGGASEFPQIPNIEKLTLSFIPFPNLNALRGMNVLRELTLETSEPIFSSNVLPRLDQVKTLHYQNYSSIDLSWMGVFENLEELSLVGSLDSFEALPRLPSLSVLDLKELGLASLKGIHHASNLVYLRIRDLSNNLDLNDLPNLLKLETLVFESSADDITPSSDISWMLKLSNLRTLILDINPKQKNLMDFLPRKLEDLYLNSAEITSLEFLRVLPRLASLNLSLNESIIDDASKVQVPPLRYLRLSTKSENFGFLPHFAYADELCLEGGTIDDVVTQDAALLLAAKIGGASDLTIKSAFQDVGWISKFSKLTILKISTLLESFQVFPEMPSLKHLVIRDAARMRDMAGIEKFPNLETIDFSQNSNFISLNSLAVLKELNEIRNARSLRGNLVDKGSCPEENEAPEGLRKFCRNLQLPFGTALGPLPF